MSSVAGLGTGQVFLATYGAAYIPDSIFQFSFKWPLS